MNFDNATFAVGLQVSGIIVQFTQGADIDTSIIVLFYRQLLEPEVALWINNYYLFSTILPSRISS